MTSVDIKPTLDRNNLNINNCTVVADKEILEELNNKKLTNSFNNFLINELSKTIKNVISNNDNNINKLSEIIYDKTDAITVCNIIGEFEENYNDK